MQTRTSAAVIYCRVKREETPKHGGDVPKEGAEEMRRGEGGVQERVHVMGIEKYDSRKLINPSFIHPSSGNRYLFLMRGCAGDG